MEIEAYITTAIIQAFPDHGVVSEESPAVREDAHFLWILDPIDGSKHYAQGIPLYSISLALRCGDELGFGIVYAPESDELYAATIGCGATLNGKPIRCSQEVLLEKSFVCLEIPNRHASIETRSSALARAARLVEQAERVRILGVSAMGLCYCAAGWFDVYVNLGANSRIWDLAAGEVILSEAGGTLTNLGGLIIAGPHKLHDALLTIIRDQ